jgi:kynurenine formamidase
VAGAVDVCCDDSVLLHTQYSTQWDALCHLGAMFDAEGDGRLEPLYYNGFRGGVDVGPECGAKALGIEHQAEFPLQTAGVLVDLHAIHGDAPARIGYDDLMHALDAQRAEVRPADVLCLHTGYAQALLDMKKAVDRRFLASHFAALDGRDERLLQWITDSGIVAIAADNLAVECDYFSEALRNGGAVSGPQASSVFPLHHHCLFKLGMMLGELWHLTHLARWLLANDRRRFLLTAPPLRLPGAVGSPVTPIATV